VEAPKPASALVAGSSAPSYAVASSAETALSH